MLILKKSFSYLWRYIAGIIIAVLVNGIYSLILKLTLVTVQGPTAFSRISTSTVFYAALSAAFFFLFRHYGRRQSSGRHGEFWLFAGGIVFLHMVIAVFVNYSTLLRITSGAVNFAVLLQVGAGTGTLRSFMDIPRTYYLAALCIQEICFIVFSLAGRRAGMRKRADSESSSSAR